MQQTVVVRGERPPYHYTTALFGSIGCAWIVGIHGFHRFYIGDIGLGVLQCITFGGCCVWSVIEWLNMENIINEANRKAGWSGQTTTTTTTTTVPQQPVIVVPQQPVVVFQQQPVVFVEPPRPIIVEQPRPFVVVEPPRPGVTIVVQPGHEQHHEEFHQQAPHVEHHIEEHHPVVPVHTSPPQQHSATPVHAPQHAPQHSPQQHHH